MHRLPSLPLYFPQDGLAGNAFDRKFAGGVNISQHHQVRRSESRTEFISQQMRPGVTVRLKNTDYTSGGRGFCRLQGCPDFRRMMTVIIHHPYPMLTTLGLKTTLGAAKARHNTGNPVKSQADMNTDNKAGQSVHHIVSAWHADRHAAELFSLMPYFKSRRDTLSGNVPRRVLGSRVDSIRNIGLLKARRHAAHGRTVKAQYGQSFRLDLRQKLCKSLANFVLITIVVQMIVLNVGNYSDFGPKLQEGPVAFIRLRH